MEIDLKFHRGIFNKHPFFAGFTVRSVATIQHLVCHRLRGIQSQRWRVLPPRPHLLQAAQHPWRRNVKLMSATIPDVKRFIQKVPI